MIVNKIYTDTTPDGATVLFQVPTTFVDGSIVAFENKADRSLHSLTVSEIGNGFYQTTEVPENGSKIIVYYDYNDESIELASTALEGLKPWDAAKLIGIMESIDAINGSIKNINKALMNRISKEEMSVVIAPLIDKIKILELTASNGA